MFGFASVHYCQKPNVKVKFYILYFQWYMPIIVSYTASGELGKKIFTTGWCGSKCSPTLVMMSDVTFGIVVGRVAVLLHYNY